MRYGQWAAGAAFVAWCAVPGAAWAVPCDDCDGDGFTTAQGDCDDDEAAESPGIASDACGDRLDNDCNGFFDDGCDLSVRQGSIQGGGGCTGNTDSAPAGGGTAAAALFVLPLLGARRRTRGAA
ncbi:MAG: hypothetical protein H0V89_02695 [Deltaproteobacteria bacterium]|nr:hypothetical protein [Deltaproteobacteria bacterium]